MKISILLLIGISCLWFFGKTQPIVVVDHATANNRLISCSKCGGTGSIEVQATCPKCSGTGKGEWHFKSKDKETPFGSKPACLSCRGTGKILRREKCPQCQGTGRTTASESQKTKTVRADLSLWEKILAYCLIKPDANCKPQRRMDGSYPLVVKYIEVMINPAYNIRVLEWAPARLAGSEGFAEPSDLSSEAIRAKGEAKNAISQSGAKEGEWIIKTVIEFKDKNGQWAQQGREFIVENREVKESRKAD